ncbi:MAG: sulfurtransferase [Rhodospirillales bacterium]
MDFAHPDLLWSPQDLAARLDDPKVRVVDARVGEAYTMGHIPGARNYSLYGINVFDTDEAPLASFVHMWAGLLGEHGIAADDTIVFYSNAKNSATARGFWFLEYLGHKDVHVLDGDFEAWVRAGLPVSRDAEAPKACPFSYTRRSDLVATRHDVLAAIDTEDTVILDTRSTNEHLGTDTRGAKHGGTIPSAVHQEWLKHMTPEGLMKPADDLKAQFEALGVTPDKEIIAYCNTGYRSAHAYLALRLLGYPRVKNYVGSWQEWGNRDDVPIVKP